jgi:hypothetical protein
VPRGGLQHKMTRGSAASHQMPLRARERRAKLRALLWLAPNTGLPDTIREGIALPIGGQGTEFSPLLCSRSCIHFWQTRSRRKVAVTVVDHEHTTWPKKRNALQCTDPPMATVHQREVDEWGQPREVAVPLDVCGVDVFGFVTFLVRDLDQPVVDSRRQLVRPQLGRDAGMPITVCLDAPEELHPPGQPDRAAAGAPFDTNMAWEKMAFEPLRRRPHNPGGRRMSPLIRPEAYSRVHIGQRPSL